MNRIEKKFRQLRKEKKKALIVFITAGYPSLSITKKLILEFVNQGVDIIELGVPFSDPLADGPLIQESSQAALKKKVNINKIMDLVKIIRKYTQIPVCLMSYYNPIFCFGEARFVKSAVSSGIDGVIIPDLTPEEGKSFINLAGKSGLFPVFFLSPTSPKKRISIISKASKGFIYYVSLTGVTGPRKKLPFDLTRNLRLIKNNTDLAVCVGFGVSGPGQVKQISKVADGVIIGSAVIKKIKENIGNPALVKKVGNFIRFLKGSS